jgi:dynactin complex subunit
MDKDKLIQFADVDEKIALEEAQVKHLQEQIAMSKELIKDLKAQKHALMLELRPAFNLRPGPKAKVVKPRKPRKHSDSAIDTTVDKS